MLALAITALLAAAPEPQPRPPAERPGEAVSCYESALASRRAQRYDQAAQSYRRCTVLAPEDPDVWFGLAESLRLSGKAADALAAYTTYVDKEKRAAEQKWAEFAKQRMTEIAGKAN